MEHLKMDSAYDSNSKAQEGMSGPLLQYLLDAVSSVTGHDLVTIADFGSATGLNSCKVLKPALLHLRSINSAKVMVYHGDTSKNDWGQLFETLQNHPDSYLSVPNVYPYAIGSSFYNRYFPDSFLDIGYANAAFQWLSKPAVGRNQLLLLQGLSGDIETDAVERGREDFLTILRHRFAELKPGGRLIFNVPERTKKIVFFEPLCAAAYEMEAQGLLPSGYLEHFALPCSSRSLEDNLKIIESMEPGFRVLDSTAVTVAHPLYKAFERTGDIDVYAQQMTEFFKAFLYPYLSSTCKGCENREELLGTFFERVQTFIKGHPEPLDLTLCTFHLEKPRMI